MNELFKFEFQCGRARDTIKSIDVRLVHCANDFRIVTILECVQAMCLYQYFRIRTHDISDAIEFCN